MTLLLSNCWSLRVGNISNMCIPKTVYTYLSLHKSLGASTRFFFLFLNAGLRNNSGCVVMDSGPVAATAWALWFCVGVSSWRMSRPANTTYSGPVEVYLMTSHTFATTWTITIQIHFNLSNKVAVPVTHLFNVRTHFGKRHPLPRRRATLVWDCTQLLCHLTSKLWQTFTGHQQTEIVCVEHFSTWGKVSWHLHDLPSWPNLRRSSVCDTSMTEIGRMKWNEGFEFSMLQTSNARGSEQKYKKSRWQTSANFLVKLRRRSITARFADWWVVTIATESKLAKVMPTEPNMWRLAAPIPITTHSQTHGNASKYD